MALTKYTYSILNDFPNQVVNDSALAQQIAGSGISTALNHIDTDEADDTCDIWFDDALSVDDQLILDGVVAAHQGTPPLVFQFKASSKVLEGPKSVAAPADWEDLGGAVTNISFFVPDVSKAWGRFSGQVRTTGAGGKLRVVRESDRAVCTPVDINVPDTAGAWVIVSFWANQNQPPDPDRFILQGYLNGATSFEVRDYAVSLMELLT